MKINPKNILLLVCGIVLGFVLANLKPYSPNRNTVTEVNPTPFVIPVDNFSINLNTESKSQLVNLSEGEYKSIEKEIDIFEKYKYLKDYVKAIDMIAPPENKDEQGWLDYYLGNDLATMNKGKPSPRFSLNVNYHLLVGYNIKKITKENNIYYANVNELRIINTGDNTAVYKADTQNLTFELISTDGNFKISKYYHTKPTSTSSLKYEGFVSY